MVEVDVGGDADGEPEVDPGAVFFPAPHRDGVEGKKDVGGDGLDGLWA